ncbi:carbohydrate kinase [Lepidopterella palustris CBS 459.81]|uniref:Gluconokinase n=1 Tax=Lepidopterella palustris CBS 459.81 TaxID=1314670 RepID=A0A8E2E7H1_9PEZI|nr:carbohydrate kinase [Lepidopterella palustris CBS 459.81]
MLQTYDQSLQGPLLYGPTSAISTTKRPNGTMPHYKHHHIWIVTGPAGCGKSTVAKYLADQYALVYIEGDDFHPQANIDKMAAGIPLNDEDRWDWLILLRDQALAALDQGAKGVVVTCSALKRKYRDVIRTAPMYDIGHKSSVHFIYLHASKEILLARVKARQGHYMKDSMVLSQLNSLEEPDSREKDRLKDVICVDVSGSMTEVQKLAVGAVNKILADDMAGKAP